MKKEYIVLAVLIVALTGYVATRHSGKTHYELPVVGEINKDDISKIEVKGGESGFSLARDDDRWRLDPEGYRADETQADDIVDEVTGLKLTALASESKNYTIYELEEGKRIDVTAYDGENVLRKFSIGKTADSHRHTFVMLDGDYRVYHAEGNMKGKFTKSVSQLRDKQVMKIDEEVAQLTIKKGPEEITLFKAAESFPAGLTDSTAVEEEAPPEEAGPRWATDDGKPAKDKGVEEVIKTVSNLRCGEYIEDKTKEDFSSPSFTLTLKGAETYTLSLFEQVDKKYQAVSSYNDYPFLLPEWQAKRIMKDPASLLEEEG